MRISDWSSDVCSSDLYHCLTGARTTYGRAVRHVRLYAGWPWSRHHGHYIPPVWLSSASSRPAGSAHIGRGARCAGLHDRSEEHTSELQSLMRISYAVFCLKKKKNTQTTRKASNNHNT